jgi:hypothetical protein
MSVEAFTIANIHLPFNTIKELIRQCERDYLLPRQVIARSLGAMNENLGEPVLFNIPYRDRRDSRFYEGLLSIQERESIGLRKNQQKRVYLAIVSQIAKAMPQKFAEVAPNLYGTKRIYFARSREAVAGIGKKYDASSIPETGWFAYVSSGGEGKRKILTELMRRVGGFSEDYIEIISRAPYEKFPALLGIELKALKPL